MSKRSQRHRMVQQDLFATVRPPAAEPPTEPAVEAAAHYERVARRKRSEVGGVPFATGPVSHATGGPLSAEEAERVVGLKTIRCSGYQFQKGAAYCKPCFDRFEKDDVDDLHKLYGYRGVLYGGAEYKGGLTCACCDQPIAP